MQLCKNRDDLASSSSTAATQTEQNFLEHPVNLLLHQEIMKEILLGAQKDKNFARQKKQVSQTASKPLLAETP